MKRLMRFAARHRRATMLAGCAGVLLAVVAGRALAINNDLSRSSVADDRVQLADISKPDAAAVARGRYVAIASDCAACHTNFEQKGATYAGGYSLQTPFGTLVSTNITPDRDAGIGTWTERDFFNALRHGRKPGTLNFLYPAMPYPAYARLSDQDVHDLWAYMATIKPDAARVKANGLPFPFNVRQLMMGWNLLFFENSGFARRQGESAQMERGRYLVDGPGHCASCHTAKNLLGGDSSAYLEGGTLQGWHAPEITGNDYRGIGGWTAEQSVAYLQQGWNHQAIAAGPMAEAVEHSTQHLTPRDNAAMVAYLRSLPGSGAKPPQPIAQTDPVMMRGRHVYQVNCTACHGQQGEGLPGLAVGFRSNPAQLAADPSSQLHVLMTGGRGAGTATNPTTGGMPSFAWKLSDADMAAVLTYVRNAFGNAAPAVTEGQAATARKAMKARSPLTHTEP